MIIDLITRGEKNPGEFSSPEGLNPGGIVNNGDRETAKFIGLLCLNPETESVPGSFAELPVELSVEKLVGFASGEAMAPARS